MSDYLASGRVEDHQFADLAGLIFREARTGGLTFESGNRRRTVWFLGGNPVAVVSDDPQDHISQLLLEHGKISAGDAQRLAELSETREALGSADFLSKETLNWGVKSRFVNLCYDLFRWEEGDYEFREGDPPRELILLKVPAHSLIFKGVGLVGQATVIDAVPGDAVCAAGPVSATDARYLAPDMRKLLDECRSGRSVDDVLGAGWDDLDQTRRMIYAFACLGLLALVRGPAATTAAPEPDEGPGFIFDEEDGDRNLVEPAPEPQGAAPGSGPLPTGGKQAPDDFTIDLPPLDAGASSLPGTDGGLDFPGGDLPSGGYSFDDDSVAGSFSSFGAGLTLDHEQEPPGASPEGEAVPGKPAKNTGRRLHLPRIAGIAFGILAAVGVLGAAGWWWMTGSEPPPPPVKPPVKRPAPEPPTAKIAPAVPATAPVAPTQTPEAQPSAPVVPVPLPQPPAPAVPAPPPSLAPPSPTSLPAGAPTAARGTDRYGAALTAFRTGDLESAAALWEALLADEHRGSFTLLLLTACKSETVRDAQRELASHELYLVTKKVDGRGCFRVCLGTFGTREAAARALAGLPSEYRLAGAAVRAVADVLNRDR